MNAIEDIVTTEFVPQDGIYLLNHSVGRMPSSAKQAATNGYFDIWDRQTSNAWPNWLEGIQEFRMALAALFNASPEEFCPQTNVSSGLSKVLGSLNPKQSKKKIVFTENDFPSIGFVLQQARKLGFDLHMIDKTKDVQDVQVWQDAIDSNVVAVLITHVHYNTNRLIPVQAISELAREQGALSIVDVAQSSGVVPIDFQLWQPDIVVGSSIKWLCGGAGAGFLWMKQGIANQLSPVDVGWFSHADPFEFDIHNFEYADSSARFWGGTPSVLPYLVAANSINLIQQIGVESIRSHNWRLSQLFLQGIDARFFVSPSNLEKKGGTSVLKFNNQEEAESALKSIGVHYDARAEGIRLSPHIYNTEQEIEAVVDCLKIF